MRVYNVRLNSIDRVKAFVNAVQKKDGSYEFVSGTYVVDAKSIMGILSLDLTKMLTLKVEQDAFPEEIAAFIC